MEVTWDFNGVSPQLKYLLDNSHLLNPSMMQPELEKADKLKEQAPPDLGAAYLGPQIWNKTMMSDDLKLEPVDWDELLNENVISDVITDQQVTDLALLMCPNVSEGYSAEQTPIAAKGVDNYPSTGSSVTSTDDRRAQQLPQVSAKSVFHPNVISGPTPQAEMQLQMPMPQPMTDLGQEADEPATAPASPNCDYRPNITDALLSTPTSFEQNDDGDPKELFDPRNRSFTDEELKPQPIIRKARKIYVPDDCKDNKYWRKREKNNVAAKRSREARRIKENQIAMRANFLEKENDGLRAEVKDLRTELKRLIDVVKGYQGEQKDNSGQ